MARFFIFLSYDGTAYHGWQVQPNAIGVQQRLNEALTTLLRTPTEVVGAGRTDTGVHAGTMVAHFDTDRLDAPVPTTDGKASGTGCGAAAGQPGGQDGKVNGLPGKQESLDAALDRLADKLNRLLPPDIAVRQIRRVRPEAHARFSALARTYHYHVYTRKDPFRRHYAVRLHFSPDFAAMNRAAAHLLEVSDFTSFSKLHTDVKTNICHVSRARWVQVEADCWRFEITADRFLRNMVRAVVGTLLKVGRGRLSQEGFARVVASKSRQAAGESVPGHALSLVGIEYPADIFL